MDNKAQGALEYLLLIGGAVLVAAVVIVILSGMATTQSESIGEAEEASTQAQLKLQMNLACIDTDSDEGIATCEAFCTEHDDEIDFTCPPA